MNHSGDAAEQIIRLSLEGLEVAAKITGSGAKNIAMLLHSVLKDKSQTKGKSRLSNMLRSGKELKVFAIKNEDVKKFQQEAKRYGVLYCVLRDKDNKSPDGIVDVIARAEDASKISRVVERFNLASVDKASIINEVQKGIDSKNNTKSETETSQPQKDEADLLLDDILAKPIQKEEIAQDETTSKNAFFHGATEKSPPSVPSSKKPKIIENTSLENTGVSSKTEKPSVREELKKIKQSQKEQEFSALSQDEKPKTNNKNNQTIHRQPNNKKKKSSKKERG